MSEIEEYEQEILCLITNRRNYCESKMIECDEKGQHIRAEEWRGRFWECDYILDKMQNEWRKLREKHMVDFVPSFLVEE